MCDISKPTKFKTKTVYKVVAKVNDRYRSVLSFSTLSIGKVMPLTRLEALYGNQIGTDSVNYLNEHDVFFNHNMVNRVSGFGRKDDAEVFMRDCGGGDIIDIVREHFPVVILKLKLGGSIMEGTTNRIDKFIPNHHKTYAGTEILSMEEI
jgi:hypothetical protein